METGRIIESRLARAQWKYRILALVCGFSVVAVIIFAGIQGLFSGLNSGWWSLWASFCALGLLGALLAPWLQQSRLHPAVWSVLAIAFGVVVYAGAVAALAFGALVLAALSVTPERWLDPQVDCVQRMICGLALLVALVGWLLPFPLHSIRAYWLVLLPLIAWKWPHILRQWRLLENGWNGLKQESGCWLALAVSVTALASIGLWLPSLNYDDNATHLLLQQQMLKDSYSHLDVSTQAWALAPWANNVLSAIAALFVNNEANPAVNLLWLLLGVHGAYRLAQALSASTNVALAAAAMYSSLPLTAYFTTSLQVDGASAALLLQLSALMIEARSKLPSRLVVSALLGLLLGLKVTNAVYVTPAVLWLAYIAGRQRQWSWLIAVAVITFALGGASYCYSMWITGNPLFPLFNATFKSTYYPAVNIIDKRWMSGASWRSIWDLTFQTNRYGEVYPGALGLALLALSPAMLVEAVGRPASRVVLFWAFVSGAFIFIQVQYVRYLFPAIAMACVVGVVGLSRLLQMKWFSLIAIALLLANSALLPTTVWYMHGNALAQLLQSGPGAKINIQADGMPERILLQRTLAENPYACVLMANAAAPFGAIGGGHAIIAKKNYDVRVGTAAEQASRDPTGRSWQRLLQATGVSHVVTAADVAPELQAALVLQDFSRVDSLGSASIWAAQDPRNRQCQGNLSVVRDEAHRYFHPSDLH